ncbi:LLM class F420-dependent oxidoreductase [Amycolatopsis sp. NPDC059021]|uniref:LLM class F420-dependent oxidoreductase n=1 Tax=Amycolatopsis sp. NPDC059021 TaxID=3346704 RepID=UPI00367252C7
MSNEDAEISVVVAGREDERPPEETLAVAGLADRLGYRHLWVGESGPTWDGFALAAAIGRVTTRIGMTIGPLPVSLRDPAMIIRAAGSVAALSGRPAGVALGTSSIRVVEGIHHRSRAHAVTVLAETAEAVARQLRDPGDDQLRAHGFRRRLPPPGGQLTVAAFGDRAIAVAARYADRMLLDLVSPAQVARLRAKLDAAARATGTTPPRLVAWLPAAVDPDDAAYSQILGSIAGYLTVRGYAEMLVEAGYHRAVELARAGAGRARLIDALPREAAHTVGLVGDLDAVRARIRDYTAAGLDEIAVLPATVGDEHGRRTLTALAPGA